MTDVRFQRAMDQKLYDEPRTVGMALTQASELSNSRIINRDCWAKIEEILRFGKAKVRTVKPDCKWDYEGECEDNLFDSGFVLQCSQSDLCVNLMLEAFCVDAVQGIGMKTFFNFPNEYTESVITAITGRIDNNRACLNLVLSNGYCVRFETECKHSAIQTKRGTIELKPITDELSDKYQNANELTKPYNPRGH